MKIDTNWTYEEALTVYNFYAMLSGKSLKKHGECIFLNELFDVMNRPEVPYGNLFGFCELYHHNMFKEL